MGASAWRRLCFDEEKPCWVVLHAPGRYPTGMWFYASIQMKQPAVKWRLRNAERQTTIDEYQRCSVSIRSDCPLHRAITANPITFRCHGNARQHVWTSVNVSSVQILLYSFGLDSSENMTGRLGRRGNRFGLCCVSQAIPTWHWCGFICMPTFGRKNCIPHSRRRFLTVLGHLIAIRTWRRLGCFDGCTEPLT